MVSFEYGSIFEVECLPFRSGLVCLILAFAAVIIASVICWLKRLTSSVTKSAVNEALQRS